MSDRNSDAEVRMGVTAFKPRSLDLIERVATGKLSRVVLTKRGRPVAAVVPLGGREQDRWGALADIMEPVEGVDLTEPTGERWADRMIIATARHHGLVLVSRDRRLIGYGDQGYVRTVTC